MEARLREAAKLGFRRCLLPQANCQPVPATADMELWGVRTVSEALQVMQQADIPAISNLDDVLAQDALARRKARELAGVN